MKPRLTEIPDRLQHLMSFLAKDTIAYALLFCASILLHFWGIGRFNTLVFDEVYFANNAYNYLHQLPFFDIHPPLGKLLIALGLKLSEILPFDKTIVTTTDQWVLPSWSYRWLNAAIGSMIPLLGAALIQTLTRRKSYAFIVGILLTLDGLLLVESRYALINIYLIFFGLLGHWLFFQALLRSPQDRSLWPRSLGFTLAGVSLGACVSIKWNGLGFLLALFLLWGLGILYALGRSFRQSGTTLFPRFLRRLQQSTPYSASSSVGDPWAVDLLRKITILRPYPFFLYLVLLPAIVYRLQWIPHLRINSDFNFWQVHRQIWTYNTNLGTGETVHPYCSTWNTWPWLIRPVAYFFHEIKVSEEANLFGLSPLSLPRIYDVHALGNPFLWWCASLAILGVFIITGLAFISQKTFLLPTAEQGILIYLLISYAANWLPWSLVGRCLYLYHYMPASLFSFFALGWYIDRSIHSHDRLWQLLGWGPLALVFFSFLYWLPIFLGLPLSPEGFHQRMWFRSWY